MGATQISSPVPRVAEAISVAGSGPVLPQGPPVGPQPFHNTLSMVDRKSSEGTAGPLEYQSKRVAVGPSSLGH